MKKIIHNRYIALIINLLLVYLMYAICRWLFLICNSQAYHDLGLSGTLHILLCGVVFDNPAIVYTNALIMVMFCIPVWGKAAKYYYATAKWIYMILNGLAIATNLCDIAYFPFTGKRTSWSVFTEFQNEGAGAITKIIAINMLTHWYLVLIFAAMMWLLWRCFITPKADNMRPHTAWKIAFNLIFAGAFGCLAVGATRGGFTRETRPIHINYAYQFAEEAAEAVAILNTPFSIIRTSNRKATPTPQYMPQEEADATYPYLHEKQLVPDSTRFGAAKGMNVVIFILESFGKQHFGYFNIDKNENGDEGLKQSFTPFLDSLLRTEALSFRHSISNSRKSIDAMPAVLASIPNFVEPFVLTPGVLNDLSGMAYELGHHDGYHTSFFHGAMNGSMGFEALSKALSINEYYGRTEYGKDPNHNGDDDYDGQWGIWDEEFLQFMAEKLDEMPQPFMSTVFTVTSHDPFKVPARYEGKLPVGPKPLMKVIAYSDNALRLFFEKAKHSDWYDNTLFVFTADHMNQSEDPFYHTYLGIHSVPIIFYAPGIDWLKGYDEVTVAQQIDIMPTVLSLLGHEQPYLAFGKDIFNIPEGRNSALYWLNEINGYVYYDGKMMYHFVNDQLKAAFDVAHDREQTTNILHLLTDQQKETAQKAIEAEIQVYFDAINNNKLKLR